MQPQDNIILQQNQNCLARALYDNIAESPDELAFRKNDILIVLEQNTQGLEGWWLCALRGRQGICPGNRLRLLAGVYQTDLSREPSPCGMPLMTDITTDLNTLQKQGKRRSWHVQPNKVLTPRKYNDVYLYDTPPQLTRGCAGSCSPVASIPEGECYDVPPSHAGIIRASTIHHNVSAPACLNYDTPRSLPRSILPPHQLVLLQQTRQLNDSQESYDVPRPLLLSQQITPSSSASSLTADSQSLSSSNRSSLANMPEYDVPRSAMRGNTPVPIPTQSPNPTLPNSGSTYDVPPSQTLTCHAPCQPKELPLELNSALDSLARLQTESTEAIKRLLNFVIPNWRRRDLLEPKLMDIRLAVVRLKTSLHDLVEFGEGVMGNAARAHDKGLALKLRPLVTALRNTDRIVQDAAQTLDNQSWSIEFLAQNEHEHESITLSRPPDALEQLIACSRALTEDVRQITSFIQGNSTLLFKRAVSPNQNNNNDGYIEDYDYVNLESKEAVAKKHAEIRDALPTELKKGYDNLIKNAETAAINEKASSELNSDDKQLIIFYAAQAVTHHTHLTQAIDAFLQTIEHNQPPKVFLAHDKFVVLSAHKLVNIGDTVHRNISKSELKTRLLNCSNNLSDALATSVAKTKQAAQQFPSVTAVQEMVDSVVDISHLARDLKLSLLQATQ